MAPVTAQVMMTLFDVAMFEASLVPSCDPPHRLSRTDAKGQIYDFAVLLCRARDGREGKMRHRPWAVNVRRRALNLLADPRYQFIQGHTGLPDYEGIKTMSIAKKIAAVSLAALTMGAVFSANQALASGVISLVAIRTRDFVQQS